MCVREASEIASVIRSLCLAHCAHVRNTQPFYVSPGNNIDPCISSAVYSTCIWHKIQRFQSSFVAGSIFLCFVIVCIHLLSVCLVGDFKMFTLGMFSVQGISSADNGLYSSRWSDCVLVTTQSVVGFNGNQEDKHHKNNISSSMTLCVFALPLCISSVPQNFWEPVLHTDCVQRIRQKIGIKESFPLIFFVPILWQWKVFKSQNIHSSQWKE